MINTATTCLIVFRICIHIRSLVLDLVVSFLFTHFQKDFFKGSHRDAITAYLELVQILVELGKKVAKEMRLVCSNLECNFT